MLFVQSKTNVFLLLFSVHCVRLYNNKKYHLSYYVTAMLQNSLVALNLNNKQFSLTRLIH